MVFSSLLFLFVYLPIVLAIYYVVPYKWRNICLFIANIVFYGWGEPVYILLMFFSITVNYIAGIKVDSYRENKKKAKRVLTINIIINISLLAFFKYYDLFASSINTLLNIHIPILSLSLPIGISFYTFQTMSYPIDIYRGDAKLQRNYISFGTFVALFPQLIAGPIVRYKDIAEQLDFRANSLEQFASGVRRFIIGLGKKVLIANNIGMLWNIYSNQVTSGITVLGAWIGIISFTLQIYFDFSGYSDMAIGLGKMLGFEFLENFDYPYISKSVTEFWRRWHISLGTWFRDYVYIPLGGNRKGKSRQFLNLFIVWSLTGFWHGANWTFLCWGIYYAIFLIIEKSFLKSILEKVPVLSNIYTLLVVIFGWVLFDLPSINQAFSYYKFMLGLGNTSFFNLNDLFYLKSYSIILIVSILACTPVLKNLYNMVSLKIRNYLTPILILSVLIISTAYLVNSTYNPFLYFRF